MSCERCGSRSAIRYHDTVECLMCGHIEGEFARAPSTEERADSRRRPLLGEPISTKSRMARVNRSPLTIAEKAEVCALYNEGLTQHEIAMRFGIAQSSVQRVLAEENARRGLVRG